MSQAIQPEIGAVALLTRIVTEWNEGGPDWATRVNDNMVKAQTFLAEATSLAEMPEEIEILIEAVDNAISDYDENRNGSERRSMEYLRAALALAKRP